jgi:hypothetical protein
MLYKVLLSFVSIVDKLYFDLNSKNRLWNFFILFPSINLCKYSCFILPEQDVRAQHPSWVSGPRYSFLPFIFVPGFFYLQFFISRNYAVGSLY